MRIISVSVVLVALVLAAGCAHGPYRAGTYGPGTTSVEHTDKIVFDASVGRSVRVVETKDATLPDGRLEAYVELENTTRKDMVVEIQAQFKDAAGTLLQDETNWQTLVLPPNTSTDFRAASMNAQAKGYLFRVRKPRVQKGEI